MIYWCTREQLSPANRLRRSYYELLRDELDQHMLQYALIDSYYKFCRKQESYPYVEKRELKPRARIPDVEYECQNAFLVLFLEDAIPPVDKKYIRFFDVNKTTKTNLLRSKTLPINDKFDRTQKYLESTQFNDFLNMLLPVDYALLIQRDTASKKKAHYALSHFHVRVDWPIADAAENMAQYLRYISKDLYERGDKYAEDIQKKFFDYYGLPVMAGGRRTAAVVAAQYLKRIPCISTVYAGSSESRAVFRFCESGFSKSVLMKFKPDEMQQIAQTHGLSTKAFKKNYIVGHEGRSGIAIFRANYAHTEHALPPADGKLREFKPDFNWVTVSGQYLLPKPGTVKYPPLPINVIYS
jgi:hypothetical protein